MLLRSNPCVARRPATAGASPAQRLSQELRVATRGDHARAEAAMAAHDWSRSRLAYSALLTVLLSFYGPAELRLRHGHGWQRLTPPVDVRARERAHLLTSDLARLGVAGDERVDASTGGDPLATGLGWLYVLEGSRLGGALIARVATASLGDDLPVAFFSGDGRSPGPGWHDFQRCLDCFGADAPPVERAQVVASARLAFATFGRCLGSGVVTS